MPTFLHESTHHWCFTSPVGSVIALIAMRGSVRAFGHRVHDGLRAGRVGARGCVEDVTRAQVVSMLLGPFAEGLATFAEFDLAPAMHSPVLPPPLRWATLFYARDELYGSTELGAKRGRSVRRRLDAFQRTMMDLAMVRHSDAWQRRKEALLVEPLSCTHSDGYLAGYLLVKNLSRDARRGTADTPARTHSCSSFTTMFTTMLNSSACFSTNP